MTQLKGLFTLFAFACVLFAIGCSNDDGSGPTGPGGTGGAVIFADYLQLVEEVAPPVYTAPAVAPTAIDSLWDSGDYPLLGKVFSSDEPMSLYSNVSAFDMFVDEFEDLIMVDDSGEYLLADSSWMNIHDLTEPVSLPTQLQPVFGQSVDLDQYITAVFPDAPAGQQLHMGFQKTDLTETILVWMTMPPESDPSGSETNYYFGRYYPADSTFVIKGATVKHFSSDTASWIYDISSTADGNFQYRMSWFSTEIPDGTLLGTIVGGGDAGAEFALKYRQWIPADTADYDTLHASEQVFGPNYSEGTGLISAYDTYLDDALIITYLETPRAPLPSPFVF